MNTKKWNKLRSDCPFHARDHLCDEPGRLEDPIGLKHCRERYCPFSENCMETAKIVLDALGREVIRADKRTKRIFDATVKRCKHRPKRKAKYGSRSSPLYAYACTHPDLEDKSFCWSCDLGNCPYMNRALDWRANNL